MPLNTQYLNSITRIMQASGKLVDKVWILALLLIASFSLAACGGKEQPSLSTDRVIEAADSASQALEGKLAIVRDTANRPSIFFDTLYRYYASARMIEVEKRLDADSLARAAVLAIDNVKDAALRRRSVSTLNAFLRRDSIRASKRDSLRNSLAQWMTKRLDSTSFQPNDRASVIQALTSRMRFEPDYRRELDSLTHNTIAVELEMLNFLENASRRIKFEEVLKFSDANDLAQYQAFSVRLAELATSQQVLVDRITYGIQPTQNSSSGVKDSVSESPVPAQPRVQTWPDAVKVQ
jgi:hypothetical protein